MRILAPYDDETLWKSIIESCEENKGKIAWRREDEIYGKVQKFSGGGDFSIKVLKEGTDTIVSVNTLSSHFENFYDSLSKRLPNCSDITQKFQKEYCVICKKKHGFLKKEQWLTWHFGEGMLCVGCYISQEKEAERKKKLEKTNDPALLCTMCQKNAGGFFEFSSGSFCPTCSAKKYGTIIRSASNGQYHGGHKAFIAGGYGNKFEVGRMILTEQYFIFVKKADDPRKRIEIIIPLTSVQVEGWTVEEESRRKTVGMGGLAAPSGFGAVGFSTGTIHDEGKAHHIVIPYLDENSIPQSPRFGISSVGGKAIRDWSEKVYEQIVSVKNSAKTRPQEQTLVQEENKSEDPLHVLKLRFAKGEISKEEYEEMKKILDP